MFYRKLLEIRLSEVRAYVVAAPPQPARPLGPARGGAPRETPNAHNQTNDDHKTSARSSHNIVTGLLAGAALSRGPDQNTAPNIVESRR